MSQLIIVESPTKARTLSRFLGSGFKINATMGHIRDLPEKRLGIEIIESQKSRPKADQPLAEKFKSQKSEQETSYEFIPDYQSISRRKENIKELKEIAKVSEKVILATDPDREGEAIAWHVKEILDQKSRPKADQPLAEKFERIVFHEITQSAIKEALLHPHEIDMQLVDAQQARRILDRLVGYKLSPLLWNKLGKSWLSAGRVQSVAVRLIVDREREIENFKSEEYWVIDTELQSQKLKVKSQNVGINFIARLVKKDEKKIEIKNKEEAGKVVEELKQASYKVVNVTTKETRRYPAPPFTTSTLQQTAANRLGWSARRTIKTAQMLYEEGFITYHRTDSTNIASEAISMVRTYIYNVYGEKYLPAAPKFYKTKSKVAQEAHEAIRPTKADLVNLPEDMGREAQLLYTLIWRRFLASQMNEAVFDQTGADIEAHVAGKGTGTYLLRANGMRMKFDGWLILYQKSRPKADLGQRPISLWPKPLAENIKDQISNTDEKEEENKELPPLVKEENLDLINVLPLQKFTEPPPRYNEASLIKTLEEKGIGRPSTYAPIISTIQERKYVEKIERKFHPTDLGKSVNDFLVLYFPDIFDIGFTARLEDELDEIANGRMKWMNVISDFYSPFNAKLKTVFKEAERVKIDLGETSEKCPDCGNPLAIKMSRYGKFLACSTYPKCKFTKNLVEKIGVACPKCGGDIIVKKTRRGKQFYGCSNYPKCTYAAWKKEDIK